jgi:hypothetical protein
MYFHNSIIIIIIILDPGNVDSVILHLTNTQTLLMKGGESTVHETCASYLPN